jgi:DNA-binding IclR family transcriptional regulator
VQQPANDGRDAVQPSDEHSVLEKAFRILGAFDEKHSHLNLSEISRRSQVPLTTTHRIVSQLMASGALERVSAGGYRVGLRLWEIASLAPRSVDLQRIALPFMQDLYETIHYPVHLAIREGNEVVFVARLVDQTLTNARPRVGGRYAIHATAVGHVLLAFAPPEVQDEILAHPLQAFTRLTETDPDVLRLVLDRVRHEELATSDRQIDTDLVSIAAPIYSPTKDVAAALSIIIPFDQMQGRSWGYLVQASARGISRANRGR